MAETSEAAYPGGPRYAPEDATLPKPWRGLVDDKTGYLYYWNPVTNVTQYERPSAPGFSPRTKQCPVPLSSLVHARAYSPDKEDNYGRGGNDGSKFASGARSPQSSRGGTQYSQNVQNGMVSVGHGRSFDKGFGGSSGVGSSLSAEDYCRQHEITVSGADVPPPLTTFEATGFPSEILREVHSAGFSVPTPIQAQSWPIALGSRDIVAVAKTGSGKTLGYLIPGFIHLKRCRNNSRMGPTILVLAPTRELATQIQVEAVKFGRSSKFSCTCLYGGAPKGPQLRDLDRGVDIVVATPGRLNDILEMRRISLRQVSYLVLDEADRMLDMGFEPQIRKIVKEVPARRQTLMFTATWPKEVRKIASDLLVNSVQVNIGNVDELVANKSITQYVEVMPSTGKQRRLEQILRSQEPGSKILIFCSTKRMCDQLSRNLARQFGAAAIHGDKSQGERDYVLSHFRTGRSPILVATDVAARGLDIKDIRVVVNYDFPTGIEDYVHRIGRTGRAGATGIAFTFLSDQDAKHASDLIKVLEGASQRVPSEIRDMAMRGRGLSKMRRWGSASSGGRSDRGGRGRSDIGGRGRSDIGGRGGRPDRRGDRGSGHDSRERDRYDRSGRGHNAGDRERPRYRSSRSRSRSRDHDRYESRGFHESQKSHQPDALYLPSPPRIRELRDSPARGHEKTWGPADGSNHDAGRQGGVRYGDGPCNGFREDEEEGMIHTDGI